MKTTDRTNPHRRAQVFTLLGALTLQGALHAAAFAFDATSTGTWTADDTGVPIFALHIEHPSITAAGLSFSGLVADETVDVTSPPFPVAGTFTFTAAGGDTLSGQYSGLVTPTQNSGEFLGDTQFLFTSGTGLFAGVSGNGTLSAEVQFTGPLDGVSTWQWDGSISLVPEPHHYGLALAGILGVFCVWRRR